MPTVFWVQMALGAFRFSVFSAAYQGFSRAAAHRWAKMERVGRAPAHQYLGPDAEEIEIEGVIFPGYEYSVLGGNQLSQMRAQAALGLPLMLVDGLGFVWGRWVIRSVSEDQALFMPDGAARRIDFRLSLTAYGEDAA